MRLTRITILILLLLIVISVQAQSDVFEPTPCPMEAMRLPATIVDGQQIRCGLVSVPKFHNNPDAGTIKVGVAIIPSTSNNPAPDPIILAQGGPGGSGFSSFPQLVLGLQIFIGDRDVIILEQRGTKYASPDLLCEEGFQLTLDILDDDLDPDESYTRSEQATLACAERLAGEGVDFAAFNSLENAADIPYVANALGYSEFNFYGVSYGTMLGQHLLNRNPPGLRSVILDANVPLSVNFMPLTGAGATRVFKLLFETCAMDEACNAAYPDLQTKYFELVARLNENPVTVDFTDPTDDSIRPALITGDTLIGLTFNAMYASNLAQNMPRYIEQMYNNDFSWLEKWGGELVLRQDFASAFYNSVMCSEDADFTQADFPVADIFPEFVPVFVRDTAKFPELCAKLGIPALDSLIVDAQPTANVPVLVLSGEFDPITPPSGGDVIVASLPNATHLVFPNGAHGQLGDTCAISIMTEFVNNPTATPDSSCIADLKMTFAIYQDDGSGLFAIPILAGWENRSTDTYTAYYDAKTQATLYAVGVQGEDVNQAIADALAVIDPTFTSAPVQTLEQEILDEIWITSVYLVGQNVRLALAKQQSVDGVYVVIIVDASQAALGEVGTQLNPIIIGIEYK
ncbi:MAG: hypothetical protein CUN52_07475 [Phototrophicales bacterium]|nr:MAG: hypothetical protein CUN52_07475 [Phototrophicales bacterium]